jgi:hypothetical protein
MSRYKAIAYVAVVAALLGLAPLIWAQAQEEQAPLSLTGNLGLGYGTDQSSGLSRSSPVADADFDLGGYWHDPRILLFHVDPFVSYGNSWASGLDLSNRGKGVNATTTFLGGSPFPLTVSYSRQWQDIPGFSSTGNVLASLSTSYSYDNLSVDTGVYLAKLPPITIHWGRGGSDTDYAGVSGTARNSFNAFSASTYYSVARWYLSGSYNINHSEFERPDLSSSTGQIEPETSDSRDLHAEAQRRWLWGDFLFFGGSRKWNDSAAQLQDDSTYNYAHAIGSLHPFSRLNVSFNAGYDGNQVASAIQQLLGVGGTSPGQGPVSPITLSALNSGTLTLGSSAQYLVAKGLSFTGDTTIGEYSGSKGVSGNSLLWDTGLNYVLDVGHLKRLTASYGYQHAENNGSTVNGNSDTISLRAGYSSPLPQKVLFSGNVHLDQRQLESVTASAHTFSPGHDYGFTVSAARPVRGLIKMAVDFDYNSGVTDSPLYFESKTKGLGIRVESPSWQVFVHRGYQDGLGLQVGNGVVFVNGQQTPLNSVLSMNSNAQTSVIGSYQPGRKRLGISATWTSFSYYNRGSHVTDASLYNFVATYRLRLLQLKAGFYQSTAQAFTLQNSSPFQRRQMYIEVIRHFSIF